MISHYVKLMLKNAVKLFWGFVVLGAAVDLTVEKGYLHLMGVVSIACIIGLIAQFIYVCFQYNKLKKLMVKELNVTSERAKEILRDSYKEDNA